MQLRLVGLCGSQAGREILIDKMPLEIGRAVNAAVRIDDRWVSRLHCRIDRTAEGVWIRDLGSTHGTLVNGRPIAEAPIAPGDRVTIGLSQFRLEAVATEPNCERPSGDATPALTEQVSVCAV